MREPTLPTRLLTPDIRIHTRLQGELSGVTVVFVAACSLWLVLWRRRTRRGWPAWPLVVLLCGAAVALVGAAMAG
ncbi:hypothetical protein [Streptomyces sp. NPDC017991]|uniref:hypothetical protein n=1 Tax=Streptomyces sp. NPDC017991 TaxID=3365026 RepID=UPI0037944559